MFVRLTQVLCRPTPGSILQNLAASFIVRLKYGFLPVLLPPVSLTKFITLSTPNMYN